MGGKHKCKELSQEEIDFIKANFRNLTGEEICKRFGITIGQVQKIRREHNLVTYKRRPRKETSKIPADHFDYDKFYF